MLLDYVDKQFDKTSYNFADRLLFEIRSSGCRGPCNAHRAWCVRFKNMFGALRALTEGWKDRLVGTALGEGVMEEYIEKDVAETFTPELP